VSGEQAEEEWAEVDVLSDVDIDGWVDFAAIQRALPQLADGASVFGEEEHAEEGGGSGIGDRCCE
jgi:hypothetical protein